MMLRGRPDETVFDNTGEMFSPSSCSHDYGYDGSGNLTTDTATDPIKRIVRVKTFTYTAGQLTSESVWVKQ